MFDNLNLTKKQRSETEVFVVSVEADSNDADYIYKTTKIEKEDIQKWIPAIKLLDAIDGWGDYVSNRHPGPEVPDELSDMLYDLIPTNSEGSCHSVELTNIEYIDENGTIWDVNLS